MTLQSDLLGEIEVHSPSGIKSLLQQGVSGTDRINGYTPVEYLTSGYLRSDQFANCLRVLTDAGAEVGDNAIEAVLFDDSETLASLLTADGQLAHKKYNLRAAFTSCRGVTLLHLCTEFNSTQCALALLDAGADINARAEVDEFGFGGQTPLFHAVNSIHNYCRPILELLLMRGASLDVSLRGLVWGEDMDWETLILDVTPISYAQCGMYRQFHRSEEATFSNLALLFRHRYGSELLRCNVPNRYLRA